MKKTGFALLSALVLFLTGVLSGHYYAYYQWSSVYQDQQQETDLQAEELEISQDSVEQDDLLRKQEHVAETGSTNFFSQLGQTLGGSPR